LNESYKIHTEDIDYELVGYLKAKVAELSQQLAETQGKLEKSLFRFANIKEDNGLVSFYTSFPDCDTLTKTFGNQMQKLCDSGVEENQRRSTMK